MKNLLPTLWTFFLYFCLATLLAQAVGLVSLWVSGGLDAARLAQIVAVLQGTADTEEAAEKPVPRKTSSTEQVSYERIIRERTAQSRSLQLREDALNNALDQLRGRQDALDKRIEREKQTREAFEAQLKEIEETAVSEGMENVRQTLTKIDPGLAKNVILGMYENKEMRAIVLLLADMDNSKRAKIVEEFQTPDELEKLEVILEKIREGAPEGPLAADTRKQL